WIRRIVVNTIIDYFRKKKVEMLLLDEDDHFDGRFQAPEVEESNSNDLASKISPEMVADAMNNLSPAYRTVFNMYVVEGYSHKEIADNLGISVGTSKSNLAKARQRLQQMLSKKIVYTNE